MPEKPLKKRKGKIGVVIKDAMDKTIVVRFQIRRMHPEYRKTVTKFSKFKVHDEKNQAKVGDRVRFAECRPISKEKHFRLVEILK